MRRIFAVALGWLLAGLAAVAVAGSQGPSCVVVVSGPLTGVQLQVNATGELTPERNGLFPISGWLTPPGGGQGWVIHTSDGDSDEAVPLAELSRPARFLSDAAMQLTDLARNLQARPVVAGGPGVAVLAGRANQTLADAEASLEAETSVRVVLPSAEDLQLIRELVAQARLQAQQANEADPAAAQDSANRGAELAARAFNLVAHLDEGDVVIDPPTFDFGDVKVGGASAPATFTLKNNSSSAIHVKHFEFGPSQVFQGDEKKNIDIPAGGSITITGTFSPNKVGEAKSAIFADVEGLANRKQCTLTGRGVGDFYGPRSDVDFGEVKVGQESKKDVTLTNTTNAPITVKFATKDTSGVFSVNVAQLIIPANGTASVTVTFAPKATQAYATQMIVQDINNKRSKSKVGLKGKGIENTSLEDTPQRIDFHTSPGEKVFQNVSVWNTSDHEISGMVDASHLDHVYFSVSGQTSFKLAPKAVAQFTLFFLATHKCKHKGKIRIEFENTSLGLPVTAVSQ